MKRDYARSKMAIMFAAYILREVKKRTDAGDAAIESGISGIRADPQACASFQAQLCRI